MCHDHHADDFEECAGIGGVPQELVDPGFDELVVGADGEFVGKVVVECADGMSPDEEANGEQHGPYNRASGVADEVESWCKVGEGEGEEPRKIEDHRHFDEAIFSFDLFVIGVGIALGRGPKDVDVDGEEDGVGDGCNHGVGLDFGEGLADAAKDFLADIFDAIHDFATNFLDATDEFVDTFEDGADTGDFPDEFADAAEDFVDDGSDTWDCGKGSDDGADTRDKVDGEFECFFWCKFAVEEAEYTACNLPCAAEFIEDFATELIEQTFSDFAEAFAASDHIEDAASGFAQEAVAQFSDEAFADVHELAVGAKELVFEELACTVEEGLAEVSVFDATKDGLGKFTACEFIETWDFAEDVGSDVLEAGQSDAFEECFACLHGVALQEALQATTEYGLCACGKLAKESLSELADNVGSDALHHLLAKLEGSS